MKNKVCIINAYFGKFPNYFQLFLNSCKYNKQFEWLIITDCTDKYNYPENVRVVYSSFENLVDRIKNKVNFKIEINNAYKLCDYRALYGIIFEEYLTDYSHWGHCDFDMIFGDLGGFITDEILGKYDKILTHGHLTIYKNNTKVNNYYKLPVSIGDYRKILGSKYHYGFDESRGINLIYKENNLKQWNENIFIDTDVSSESLIILGNENYDNQYFIFDKGIIKQMYMINNKTQEKKYAYIHLQKRKMSINDTIEELGDKYIISNNGFYKIDSGREMYKVTLIEKIKRKIWYKKTVFNIKLKWNLQWKVIMRIN